MKKVTTIFAAILLLAVAATAQNPKLSYSAVVRNSANELVANQTITVAVSIANSETGAAVYSETHNNVQTNQNGLVSLTIGDGTVVGGDFANVNWTTAYITTQYTLPDGSSLVSTMPVNAVPYALYADNISPESLLGAVSAMTDEQKAALKEALGVTGGSDAPTTFTCGTSKMVDADGNEYETVQIGTQCWTKTNLRSTKDRNGNLFINGMTASTSSYNEYVDSVVYIPTDAAWSENNSSVTYDEGTFGYYYNWPAAMLVCPAGWHLPSDAEWTTMEQTQTSMDVSGTGWRGDHAGKLAGEGWNASSTVGAPGNATDPDHNASGFSAVPAGYWASGFDDAGDYADFWSSTEYGAGDAWYRTLGYGNANVDRNSFDRAYGFSVRCLRD